MEAAQIDAALAKLEDLDYYARRAAVEALGKHEAVLAQHAAAVAASDRRARRVAAREGRD